MQSVFNDEDRLIEEMKYKYEHFSLVQNMSFRKEPLFPLNFFSIKIAEALCLNNYEISIIQHNYLSLWDKCKVGKYIRAKHLFSAIGCQYSPAFEEYFKITDKLISIDDVLQFIGIFVFFSLDLRVKIMMSVCGYQSNISLSYEHVNEFFHSLHEHSHLDPALETYLVGKDPSDFASLKEVVALIHSSYSLISVFDNLKRSLINSFVGKDNYLRICARMQYYNSYLDGFYMSPMPKEKCSEIISRLIVPKPPLLYTEYRKPDDDFKRIKASIIFEIRSKYGYCKIAERESPKSVLRYDLRCIPRRNRYMKRSRAKTDTSPIVSFGSAKIHPIVIVTNPSSPSLLI